MTELCLSGRPLCRFNFRISWFDAFKDLYNAVDADRVCRMQFHRCLVLCVFTSLVSDAFEICISV